jgi:nucleoside-diphosphate-sugar epimerase
MVNTIAQVLECSLPKWRVPLMPFLMVAAVMETVLKPLGIQPPLHRRRMDFFRKSFFFKQDLMRSELGYSPTVTFENGARQTSNWYRERGDL